MYQIFMQLICMLLLSLVEDHFVFFQPAHVVKEFDHVSDGYTDPDPSLSGHILFFEILDIYALMYIT
jgi:hypothetical protein